MSTDQRYSYSALSDFKACPLRYRLRRVDNLELRDASANQHHLAWGKAFHAGLEVYYNWLSSVIDPSLEVPPALVQKMQIVMSELYPLQLDPLDRAKTQENGLRALALYVQRWADEDRKWRVIDCEGLDTPGESSTGLDALRLDLVAENLERGGIYGWDHKTTSKPLGARYWEQYNPNSQITQYVNRIQEKYGACKGFIINVTSLEWREPFKKDGANNVAWFAMDDPNMGWLAYSHHEERKYRGGPLGKAGPRMVAWGLQVAFERQVFNRSAQQILQERLSTRQWIEQIESANRCLHCGSEEEDHSTVEAEGHAFEYYWPFNTGACYSCEYRGSKEAGGICGPGYVWPDDREIILLTYRQVCRRVIQVVCPACGGNGIDPANRIALRRAIENDETWLALDRSPIEFDDCPRCKGNKRVDGPRCVLDLNHANTCADVLPIVSEQEEILIEVSE